MKTNLSSVKQIEVKSGCLAQFIHGKSVTTAMWEIAEGAEIPLHHHVHEQVSLILEGQLEMTVGGVTEVYGAGDFVVIPSNVPHKAKGITQCKAYDVFCPVREDYVELSK